jgi:hypothetical protein
MQKMEGTLPKSLFLWAMAAMDCGLGLKMILIFFGINKSDGMIIGMRDDCLIGFKIIYMTPSII